MGTRYCGRWELHEISILGAEHAANLARTAALQRRIDALFDRNYLLIAPSATGEAPLGINATGDPLFCRGWTLLGLPCVHLPFTTGQHGLPTGPQPAGEILGIETVGGTHFQRHIVAKIDPTPQETS